MKRPSEVPPTVEGLVSMPVTASMAPAGVEQLAGRGQEGQAGQVPVELVVQLVRVEDRVDALLDGLGRLLGGEAQIEDRRQRVRDDVVGAGAGVEVGDLQAGGRKVLVARVPLLGDQGRQAGAARWMGLSARCG
jgi:hypothetical protein